MGQSDAAKKRTTARDPGDTKVTGRPSRSTANVVAASASNHTRNDTQNHIQNEAVMSIPPLQAGAALHHTAVRDDGGCSNVAGPVSCQESNDAGYLFRLRHAAQWNGGIQLLQERRIGHGGK